MKYLISYLMETGPLFTLSKYFTFINNLIFIKQDSKSSLYYYFNKSWFWLTNNHSFVFFSIFIATCLFSNGNTAPFYLYWVAIIRKQQQKVASSRNTRKLETTIEFNCTYDKSFKIQTANCALVVFLMFTGVYRKCVQQCDFTSD